MRITGSFDFVNDFLTCSHGKKVYILPPISGVVNLLMSSLRVAMEKRSVIPPMSDVVAGFVVGAVVDAVVGFVVDAVVGAVVGVVDGDVVGTVVGSGVIIAAAGHLANLGGTRGHSGPRRAAVGRRTFLPKKPT